MRNSRIAGGSQHLSSRAIDLVGSGLIRRVSLALHELPCRVSIVAPLCPFRATSCQLLVRRHMLFHGRPPLDTPTPARGVRAQGKAECLMLLQTHSHVPPVAAHVGKPSRDPLSPRQRRRPGAGLNTGKLRALHAGAANRSGHGVSHPEKAFRGETSTTDRRKRREEIRTNQPHSACGRNARHLLRPTG